MCQQAVRLALFLNIKPDFDDIGFTAISWFDAAQHKRAT
ncbi:hypothetical protein PPEP_a1767 [Pseudoalteromonas peptidolytica F12-50-A1]|uniref:Uncharacterized protein n=1 Tax=Pseudoalteromonas peptidolytica F12-50-A1 TaxID=1315280 RepID=A0A8I0MWR4_9GAMM|nr:hypothetical protein [Pseudoalteromonas peptidolytica F12-50-A1]